MHVTFQIKKAKTQMGENLFIIGSQNNIGNWKVRTIIFYCQYLRNCRLVILVLFWMLILALILHTRSNRLEKLVANFCLGNPDILASCI